MNRNNKDSRKDFIGIILRYSKFMKFENSYSKLYSTFNSKKLFNSHEVCLFR